MNKREEIKARLRYAFPYFESDDKDDWFYLVREQDLDRAVESILALFEEDRPAEPERWKPVIGEKFKASQVIGE